MVARVLLMRRSGMNAMHFGKIDKNWTLNKAAALANYLAVNWTSN